MAELEKLTSMAGASPETRVDWLKGMNNDVLFISELGMKAAELLQVERAVPAEIFTTDMKRELKKCKVSEEDHDALTSRDPAEIVTLFNQEIEQLQRSRHHAKEMDRPFIVIEPSFEAAAAQHSMALMIDGMGMEQFNVNAQQLSANTSCSMDGFVPPIEPVPEMTCSDARRAQICTEISCNVAMFVPGTPQEPEPEPEPAEETAKMKR
jgi:hypothetical protein